MNKICKFAIEDIKDKDGIYNEEKLIKSCSNIIRPEMTEEEILLSWLLFPLLRQTGTITPALIEHTNKPINIIPNFDNFGFFGL